MNVGDDSPEKYFKQILRGKQLKVKEIMRYNALPENWCSMKYNDFLMKRRKLMSKVIKEGYERLMK